MTISTKIGYRSVETKLKVRDNLAFIVFTKVGYRTECFVEAGDVMLHLYPEEFEDTRLVFKARDGSIVAKYDVTPGGEKAKVVINGIPLFKVPEFVWTDVPVKFVNSIEDFLNLEKPEKKYYVVPTVYKTVIDTYYTIDKMKLERPVLVFTVFECLDKLHVVVLDKDLKGVALETSAIRSSELEYYLNPRAKRRAKLVNGVLEINTRPKTRYELTYEGDFIRGVPLAREVIV